MSFLGNSCIDRHIISQKASDPQIPRAFLDVSLFPNIFKSMIFKTGEYVQNSFKHSLLRNQPAKKKINKFQVAHGFSIYKDYIELIFNLKFKFQV